MIPPEILEIAAKSGLIGICIFVIWSGLRREDRQSTAFELLNQQQHEAHVKTIEQLTELNINTRNMFEEMKSRPCVNDNWDGNERRRRDRDSDRPQHH